LCANAKGQLGRWNFTCSPRMQKKFSFRDYCRTWTSPGKKKKP